MDEITEDTTSQHEKKPEVLMEPPKVEIREPEEEKEEKRTFIVDQLDVADLKHLRLKFKLAPGEQLTQEEVRELLKSYDESLSFSDEEFHIMALKMDPNYKNGGGISWRMLSTYMLMEYKEKRAAKMGTAQLLLAVPIRERPKFLPSYHRHPVVRIAFFPAITRDRIRRFSNGKYITVSQDGVIHVWSLNMKMETTWLSTSPILKVAQTWITDLVCLPDVNFICTSTTERELRFYEITANNFELRIAIASLDFPAISLSYRFEENINENSILIAGDMGGNVKIFEFSSIKGGPFIPRLGEEFSVFCYSEVIKGELTGLKVTEHGKVHGDWVKKVSYCKSLHSAVSCSHTSTRSVVFSDKYKKRRSVVIDVDKGVNTFCIDEITNRILTGGPNHLVYIWDILSPKAPSRVYMGNQSSIVTVLLDTVEDRIYSLSSDRVIKVWDIKTENCIQTYTEKLKELGPPMPMTTLFNHETRTLYIASMKIVLLKLGNVIDYNYSDGYTHSRSVTKALYNPLFKVLITVGMDSCIMSWQPLTGKRTYLIQNAHRMDRLGEIVPVGITTAAFNPTNVYLITGAIDGTIKLWNFNNGICLRLMSIEKDCSVTDLIWIECRILGVGWNRHVREWEDTTKVGGYKDWQLYHTEDILSSCLCPPAGIATSSCTGELIFSSLQTGQSYKQCDVSNPFVEAGKRSRKDAAKSRRSSMRRSTLLGEEQLSKRKFSTLIPADKKVRLVGTRRSMNGRNPKEEFAGRMCVHCMLFLNARPPIPENGTLFVAIENGTVQLWSHHTVGGFINTFFAIHAVTDYVISMNTDSKNTYLFTGHVAGYLKVWLIQDYGIKKEPEHVSMPRLRLKFPFLLKDRFLGRAKRAARYQRDPMLLSSYRAHVCAVNHIEYIESNEIIATCGTDASVRLWTLGGQYIGTLGGITRWVKISPNQPVELKRFRVPPDVKRVASSTTLKVITNGYMPETKMVFETEQEAKYRLMLEDRVAVNKPYGVRLEEPAMGHHYELPQVKARAEGDPVIDLTMSPNLRILNHMKAQEMAEIIHPPAPSFINDPEYRMRKEDYLAEEEERIEELNTMEMPN